MKKINYQIRNLLKCTFVDKIIISNHNSDITIDNRINVKDNRLVLLNQETKCACGYRWQIAKKLNAEYLISIDDDPFLFPQQLKILCEQLILQPQIPHRLSGIVKLENGGFEDHDRENIEVDYLCEIYAVTKRHVEMYFQLEHFLGKKDENLLALIERLGDYIVISQTGSQKSRIHEVGRLFRDETFKRYGVANHKNKNLELVWRTISETVGKIQHQFTSEVCISNTSN